MTDYPSFDLQGHRGARGLLPENTLPGFEAALAIGVTTLELDVGLTKDGVLVVHHDRNLNPDRTRGADGAWLRSEGPSLRSLTLAALGSYDVGRIKPDSDYAERYSTQQGLDGVTVPALVDVLARGDALSAGRMRYNIEIKTSPLDPEETAEPETFAAALAGTIRAAGAENRATVQSFDWRGLVALKEVAPEIATAFLTAQQTWLDNVRMGQIGTSPWTAGLDLDGEGLSVPQAIDRFGGSIWSPYFRDLNADRLAEAQGLGIKVIVWTVNEPADMAALIDLGIDGIITDYPDRLRRVMAEKGLPLPPAYQP